MSESQAMKPRSKKARSDAELKRDTFEAALPRLAGRTLPACFRGHALIGLPRLGSFSGSGHGFALACRASFIGAELQGKSGTTPPRSR